MSALLLPTRTTLTPELPAGLQVKRKGEAFRHYASPKGRSSLLSSAGGSDLILGTLKTGESLYIAPKTVRGYIEVYFVISGRLELKTEAGLRVLGANTHIASDELDHLSELSARENTQYLYFSTNVPNQMTQADGVPVEAKDGSFHLRFANGRVELMHGKVKADKDIFLSPFHNLNDERFGTQEVYYLLKGCLWYQNDHRIVMVEAGDYITVDNIEESVRFMASEEVEFIYFSGMPSFQDIRIDHGDLAKLAVEIEKKDGYTAEHCTRLRTLSMRTAELLELSDSSLLALSRAAFLHDVGKVKVPLSILLKPAKLNEQEWLAIKKHPTFGKEMVTRGNLLDANGRVGMIIEQHHERMDGSGYPYGLSGNQILTEAYIVAVADTFDAMTTDRPYRDAFSVKVAFEEIKKLAGVHYPQRVISAFIAANHYDDA